MPAYTHKQATPAKTWSIQHDLGYEPAVTTFTDATPPVQVVGNVKHTSDYHTDVYFTETISGIAYLS